MLIFATAKMHNVFYNMRFTQYFKRISNCDLRNILKELPTVCITLILLQVPAEKNGKHD